jgi:hypothetical protein
MKIANPIITGASKIKSLFGARKNLINALLIMNLPDLIKPRTS